MSDHRDTRTYAIIAAGHRERLATLDDAVGKLVPPRRNPCHPSTLTETPIPATLRASRMLLRLNGV